MATIAALLDHHITVRHFVLKGILAAVGDRHGVVVVFPHERKRVCTGSRAPRTPRYRETPDRLVEDCVRLRARAAEPDLADRLRARSHYFVEPSARPYVARLEVLLTELLVRRAATSARVATTVSRR